MATSAFTRHSNSERGVRRAVDPVSKQLFRWAATYAAPTALSLGLGSVVTAVFATSALISPAIAQSSTSISANTVLANGDQGEAVSRLQQRLLDLGLFTSELTGYYGPLTEEAVMRYQDAQGLIADGIAGPETLSRLLLTAADPQPTELERTELSLDGEQLQILQAKLASLNFYLGEIDGVYGPQTEAAINSFQNVYALPVTGVADRQTLTTLDRIYVRNSDGIDSISSGSFPTAVPYSIGTATGQVRPLVIGSSTQVSQRVSSAQVTLPPAIPSGPSLVANIPQTTTVINQLPPPSLPSQQANSNLLPPFSSARPIRQTAQTTAEVSGYPYIVAVPVKTGGSLAEVRQVAGNAFLAGSKRGTYIQAGAYNRREDAEQATQTLRNRSIDARVVYRPN